MDDAALQAMLQAQSAMISALIALLAESRSDRPPAREAVIRQLVARLTLADEALVEAGRRVPGGSA